MDLDATTQFDQIIGNYSSSDLILWITLGVIVVALIALGTEFWANLWGMILSPSLTFQRLLGEAQWVPGVVVTAIIGMACSAIILAYFANPVVIENLFDMIDPAENQVAGQMVDQLDNIFEQIGTDFRLNDEWDNIQKYEFLAQTIAMALPIGMLLLWILWGLAAQLGSMIAGNKAGHGITNIWSSLPYAYIPFVLSTWFFMMGIFGNSFAQIMYYIMSVYFLFLHVVLMREHGRYDIGKSIVATIITLILLPIFALVVVVAILFLTVQLDNLGWLG